MNGKIVCYALLALLVMSPVSAAEGKPFKELEEKIDRFIEQADGLMAAIDTLNDIEAKAILEINALWGKVMNQEGRIDVLEDQVETLETNTFEAQPLKAMETNARQIDRLRDTNFDLSIRLSESERKLNEVLEHVNNIETAPNNSTFHTIIYESPESNYSECLTGTVIGGGGVCGDEDYVLQVSAPRGNGWQTICKIRNNHLELIEIPLNTYAVCLVEG